MQTQNLPPVPVVQPVKSGSEYILDKKPNLALVPELPYAPFALSITNPAFNIPAQNVNWSKPESFGGYPLLFDEVQTPEINADCLPPWLRDYITELAQQNQISKDMLVMNGFILLSALLQKQFVVSPYEDNSYLEPLTLRSLTTAPSSARNAVVIDAMKEPIIQWEKQQLEKWSSGVGDDDVYRCFYKKKKQALTRKAVKAEVEAETLNRSKYSPMVSSEAKHHEAKNLLIKASVSTDTMPFVSTLRKIIATNVTENNLIVDLEENCGAITILSEDINLLKIMDSELLLQSYSNGIFKGVMSKKKPVILNNIAISVGLTVPLEKFETLRNHGLKLNPLFLYCMPQSVIGRRNFRYRTPTERIKKLAYNYGIDFLLNLPPALTYDEIACEYNRIPRVISLSDEAFELWLQFCDWLEIQLIDGGKLEHIREWASNLPGQVLRLAGLAHITWLIEPTREPGPLSPSSPLSTISNQNWEKNSKISKKTMEQILELCGNLIIHAKAVYEVIDTDNDLTDAKYAFNWLLGHIEMDENEALFIRQHALHSDYRFRKSKSSRVNKVLDQLYDRNILSPPCTLSTRKPTQVRYVNPLMFNQEKFNPSASSEIN